MDNKLWFKAKTYGWGWYPVTWQGWLVIFIWAIFFTLSIINTINKWPERLIIIILSVSILIYICYKKGEKPGWRWGKEKINDKK
jgi:hypothetical protein